MNGNNIGIYYRKIWSASGFLNFDKTVGGYIYIQWRDDRAYRSEASAYGYASSGDNPNQASWASIEKGKFNYLQWFGIRG